MLVGLVVFAVALVFSFVVGVLMFEQFQSASGNYSVTSHQYLYEGLWLVFLVSLSVLGLSLVISGFQKRQHDIVPGPTLYLMGASLLGIALMMTMYGQVLHAVVAAMAGVTLMVIEWYYDVV